MLGTLLDFYGNIRVMLKILCQPDCAEVTPPQFLNNHISVKKDLPDVNWMVATNLVVRHTLVFARILFVEKFVINHFSQGSKIKMCEAVFLSIIFGGL